MKRDVSTDGREVWDAADRLSMATDLIAKLNRARQQLHNAANTCGSCSKWMTPDCPRETRTSGPTSLANKCAAFVIDSLSAKSVALGEIQVAELQKQLDALRNRAS